LLLVFVDKLGFLGQISSSVRLAAGGLVFKKGMFWFMQQSILDFGRDVLAEVFILFAYGCVVGRCRVFDMLYVYTR
jgi:hypothetical protein